MSQLQKNLGHEYQLVQNCSQVPSDGGSTSNPSGGGVSGGGGSGSAPRPPSEFGSEATGYAHTSAIALRLRVTQVVCGIMTCVVGAVACIEERGHFRLGTGVVAGTATVVASIASIHATFNDFGVDRARWIQYTTTSSGADCGGRSCVLSGLWALAVVANMVMLAFAFMAFLSCDKNLIVIGSLELVFGVLVLAILVGNLLLAMHYRGHHKK